MTQSGKAGPIRAILFDKDGTLVDFQRSFGPAVREVMQQLSGNDAAAYQRLVTASRFVEDGPRLLPDSPLIAEPTSVYGVLWATALGRPANATLFAEIDRLLCDATTRHLTAIGDPGTLLASLAARGYRLGLVTNDAEITARAHARKLGLDGVLEFVAGYDSGFGAKPDPGPVLAFAQAAAVAASEIAVVGDSVHDLAAARAAGAVAIGVLTGPAPSAVLAPHADAVLGSAAELPAWLDSR
ncbi:HAD family hydrolase [Bradyrhizobium sediminis]|uniref:phosphoglycolate phosphatase n=1 Tax=Bradyrhizobium sediminis TaxID=2840469 RepID=A0A975RTS0_9BRAD|nr:HAD family hydrolase [Bradyrhizobium sediminis]QWG19394.1 HAD family hydrolase [Bradyrhizobium sediminis]